MRFLHLADLHLGKRVNDFSMIEDQKYMLEKIMDIVEKKNIDGVFIAGDVYDKTMPGVQAVRMFDDFLTKLSERKKDVYIISGNHDSSERIAFGSDIFDKQRIYVSPVYDGKIRCITKSDEYGEMDIYLLPFLKPQHVKHIYPDADIETYDDAIKMVMSTLETDDKKRNIILAHQFITGATVSESEELSVGGIDNVNAVHFDRFDYVALGHIHKRQKIRREEMLYSGTMLKYSFSEEHHKKVAVIADIKEKGNITIEEIELKPLRDLRSIKGKFEDIVKRAKNDEKKDDYIHIILFDEEDIPEAMGRLRAIYPNIMMLSYDNLRTKFNTTGENDVSVEKKSPLQLLMSFYEKQNNNEMTKEQIEYAKRKMEEIW